MNTNMDSISVIIPTHNRKLLLPRAIDSVLNQSYKAFEIIIVDDCSTDGTMEYITELYGDINNIIYIRNSTNIGQSASRNTGVLQAKGEWIAFLDDDDEWMSDKLEKQMKAIKSKEDAVFCYTSFVWSWSNGLVGQWPQKNWEGVKAGDVFSTLLLTPLVGMITVLIKREVYFEIGGFNENLRAMEDYEFTLRVAYSYEFVFVEDVLAVAHVSEESVGKRNSDKIVTQCYIMNLYKSELQQYGILKKKFLKVLQSASECNSVKLLLSLLVNDSDGHEYIAWCKEYVALNSDDSLSAEESNF